MAEIARSPLNAAGEPTRIGIYRNARPLFGVLRFEWPVVLAVVCSSNSMTIALAKFQEKQDW
jgi:hypothetical protein